ncbi:NAC domain-containing protein 83-like [Mangifera indica]|uniref:NAC domain-containing protein 83-like n=1 Tax=Mangifera indica TaxID=29780 RepID=UPI001CFA6697|nr:NAC domain-containing protein 83-like [Mangifera indica]
MEKQNFVVNSRIKLPIGYRFCPTDEELVVHYLKRKVFGMPLPASVIPELDVFQADPWSLPGDLKEKRYFFMRNITGNVNDSKCKIAAGSGYWKSIGKHKQIMASGSYKQAVGSRKTLVFRRGKPANNPQTKTRWLMHEYRLLCPTTNLNSTHLMSDWIVYRIFQRKRKPKKHGSVSNYLPCSNRNQTVGITRPSRLDFSVEDQSDLLGPPQPCSSSSSEITDEICLDQEETSGYTSFFSYSCVRKS